MMEIQLKVHPAFGNPLEIRMTENSFSYRGDVDFAQSGLHQNVQSEFKLPTSDYNALVGDLKKVKLPLMPEFVHGLDGITYTLSIGDGVDKASFRWWMKCPEEWKELEYLVERLTAYAKRKANS